MPKQSDELQKRKEEIFFNVLKETANVTLAAKSAKVDRTSYFRKRKLDPEFAARWEEALNMGLDALEDAGIERAKEVSDKLLIFFLKAHRPEKYGDKINIGGRLDLFNGMEIEKLISIAKRGCNHGGDSGSEE